MQMESTLKTKIFRSGSERAQIVSSYEASGLSQEAFCKREGIAKSSLYKWCREKNSSPAFQPGFINVEAKQASGWSIELELQSGTVLRCK
jgi:transposase-like protein